MTRKRLTMLMMVIAGACSSSEEAKRVTMPVIVDGSGVTTCTNDLGFEISVTSFRLAIRDLEMTIGGETHASLLERVSDLILPSAYAHPGHYAGGEITGELPGNFVIDFAVDDGDVLGDASLLEGAYHGLNFTFRAADAADGLPGADPLVGHTAHIEGTAVSGEESIDFEATLDIDDGTQVVGAPFDLDIEEGQSGSIGLELLTIDPFESDTIFDGLDFAALDEDHDGQVDIVPGQPAHNLFRRTVQVHDQYFASVKENR